MRRFGKGNELRPSDKNMKPIDASGSFAEPFAITRRHFFARTSRGLGAIALASLLPRSGFAVNEPKSIGGLAGLPHFAPKAKRIIYLFQSGGPAQMDLFDYKPLLNKLNGQQLPEHVR